MSKTTKGRWRIEGSSVYESLLLSRAVLEALYDSIPKFSRLPIEDQLEFFSKTRLWPNEKFIKFAKYVTAWPMARHMHQILPVRPEGFSGSPLVFTGKVKRLLKGRLISHDRKSTALWLTYLQGVKRGAASVTDRFIYDSMRGHAKAMSTPPDSNVDLSIYDDYVARTLGKWRPDYKTLKMREASTSASFERKKSEGGARSFLMDSYCDGIYDYHESFCKGLCSCFNYFEKSNPNELLGMMEVGPGKVVEMRGFPTPCFGDLVQDRTPDEGHVWVSGVKEPLKVRLISKGNSRPYYIARSVQKDMWNYLQQFPQFVLTGRPMDISDIVGLRLREQKLGFSFPKWVSGDYSAATDGLDFRMTEKFFKGILLRYDFDRKIEEDLWNVIGLQTLHYPRAPKDGGPDIGTVKQMNGQLMGSPLSFPILCMINLVAYWAALQEYSGRLIRLEDLPVLINGDDILFRADQSLYDIWKLHIKNVGFSLSIGKNYFHETLLMINSQMFAHIGGPSSLDFREIHYLNCGLLTGQSKLSGRIEDRCLPVWDLYNRVIPGARNAFRAHQRFLHYNKELIKEATGTGPNGSSGNFNLFLPRERGGLGFIRPRTVSNKITNFQQKFASYLEGTLKNMMRTDMVDDLVMSALVRTNRSSVRSVSIEHHIPLVRVPSIGPLEKSHCSFSKYEISYPKFSFSTDVEKPELTLRCPYRLVKEFRKGLHFSLLSRSSCSYWPFRLVEVCS
jgi:hypothetical protein